MDLSFWRDLSLFYLLTMQLIVTLLMAAALYFLLRAVVAMRRKATDGVHLARKYVGIAHDQGIRLADKGATPLIRMHARFAYGVAILRALRPGQPSVSQTKESSQ
ncbi:MULTISPECIES: hypothetical protein [Caldilinea]|jgi:hypothetical protein|uniref:Uncharacterized protein n=1 Tax=Caldilinea aerophila (strain DSM 14535 / JCM 11387 / NBRC 104270 / STL-6-O1) TaxID=926550 RepID=I0I1S2_CALAS|nr:MULTISPECIES: hypothetical protein [Caldilinea]MBO9394459.1 hypothetical protein [Caldilinea sp.]BAL99209.1 hypothetical protein CLDAP_11700 [Caldilinea aerophila DSM 14535 = NBRC 104270]GIV74198.1 MAG: hypothetical protein KatS3mg049_2754 [Caldilinea sp.]